MPDIPAWKFPLELDANGGLREVEQGSVDDIISRVHVLILTPPGWLDSLPDFGLADQAHREGGADIPTVEDQLDRYIGDDIAIAVEEDLEALNDALSVLDIRIGG